MATAWQHEEFLRRLAINNKSTLRSLLGDWVVDGDCIDIEAKTRALFDWPQSSAVDSHATTYQSGRRRGARRGCVRGRHRRRLGRRGPAHRLALVAAAAPALAAALGYNADDVEQVMRWNNFRCGAGSGASCKNSTRRPLLQEGARRSNFLNRSCTLHERAPVQ